MTEKYNLTWEEAEEAMKRGAICQIDAYFPLEYTFIKNKLYIVSGSGQFTLSEMPSHIKKCKWRIVELTDCKFHTLPKIFLANPSLLKTSCIKHNVNYVHTIDNHHIDKSSFKDKCISMFTTKIKEDLSKKKEDIIIWHDEYHHMSDAMQYMFGKNTEKNIDKFAENHPILKLIPRGLIHDIAMPGLKLNTLNKSQQDVLAKMKDEKIRAIRMQDNNRTRENAIHRIQYAQVFDGHKWVNLIKGANEMNVSQALEWMVSNQGKKIISEGGSAVRYYDSKIIGHVMSDNYYVFSLESYFSYFSSSIFKIVKDNPVNELGLAVYKGFQVHNFGHENELGKALTTYVELLHHSLVVSGDRKDGGRPYFYMDCDVEEDNIGVDIVKSYSFRADTLSPFFDSSEDAEKASKDIGQKKLVHMFKALKGIK